MSCQVMLPIPADKACGHVYAPRPEAYGACITTDDEMNLCAYYMCIACGAMRVKSLGRREA